MKSIHRERSPQLVLPRFLLEVVDNSLPDGRRLVRRVVEPRLVAAARLDEEEEGAVRHLPRRLLPGRGGRSPLG